MRSMRYPFLHSVMPRFSRHPVLDVVVLDDSDSNDPALKIAKAKSAYAISADRKPWTLWSGAGLVTVLVHLLFVGSLTLGTGKRSSRPPEQEGFQAAGQNADGTESVSVLFFVQDKSIHAPEEGNEPTYTVSTSEEPPSADATTVAATDSAVASTPPSLAEVSADADATQDTDGDGGEAALLFGRYMGQIKARIERAWEYASTTTSQKCRVQIRQSREGDVQDIAIQRCDLTADQQMTLVRAIQSASPLSAPPSEKVFTEVVTLSFTTSPRIAHASDIDQNLNARRSVQLN